MLAYYDERAPEYEEAYTLGTGTASITDPEVFKAEARLLAGIVGRIARGRMMDLACGTAYWLPHYAQHCGHMTLFDQSDNMLAEARGKATRLGVLDRCDFVRGDFFEQAFGECICDTVLVGYFLSHLSALRAGVLRGLRSVQLGCRSQSTGFVANTVTSVVKPRSSISRIPRTAWAMSEARSLLSLTF